MNQEPLGLASRNDTGDLVRRGGCPWAVQPGFPGRKASESYTCLFSQVIEGDKGLPKAVALNLPNAATL